MDRQTIGKAIIRVSLTLVFFRFGFSQLTNPTYWTGFIPTFATAIATAKTLVLINGIAEIILAILLIAGFYTRIVALLLSIHLFVIALSIGWDPVAVRDFGLACAALGLFFLGPDKFCLDSKLAK